MRSIVTKLLLKPACSLGLAYSVVYDFREYLIYDNKEAYWSVFLDVFFTSFLMKQHDINAVPRLIWVSVLDILCR